MGMIFLSIVCFVLLVLAVFIFATRERGAAQDLKKEIHDVNMHMVDAMRIVRAADELAKTQVKEMVRLSDSIHNLEKQVEWHRVKIEALSAKPMNINVSMPPLRIRDARHCPTKKPDAKLVKKIKGQIKHLSQ